MCSQLPFPKSNPSFEAQIKHHLLREVRLVPDWCALSVALVTAGASFSPPLVYTWVLGWAGPLEGCWGPEVYTAS